MFANRRNSRINYIIRFGLGIKCQSKYSKSRTKSVDAKYQRWTTHDDILSPQFYLFWLRCSLITYSVRMNQSDYLTLISVATTRDSCLKFWNMLGIAHRQYFHNKYLVSEKIWPYDWSILPLFLWQQLWPIMRSNFFTHKIFICCGNIVCERSQAYFTTLNKNLLLS